MKYRPIIYLIFFIILLTSCTSSTPVTLYSEEQLQDGNIAIKEMMKEAYTASIEKSRSAIPSIQNNLLFNETQKQQFEQAKDLPGIEKRLETFKKQLIKDLDPIFDALTGQILLWIENLEISSPYQIILGDKDAVSVLFINTISPKMNLFLTEKLINNNSINDAFKHYLTIINAYVLTGKTSEQRQPEEIVKQWDPSTLSTFLVKAITDEIATQEAIIRYLAPSYDSPFIRLFNK